MGALAEEFGYGDSGECLTVADKNEVWQFEIYGTGKNGKGKKVRIFKYNPKKGYRKRQGHRQPYTKVEIGKISVRV